MSEERDRRIDPWYLSELRFFDSVTEIDMNTGNYGVAPPRRNVVNQYSTAIHSMYDELYEMNVTRGTYRIIYYTQEKYVNPPVSGDLKTCLRGISNEMIHPDDKAKFLSFFNLGRIRADFAAENSSLMGEFRKLRQDGGYSWTSMTLCPLKGVEDDEIYLCFVMDIHAKKRAEEIEEQNRTLQRRNQDDERYRIMAEQTGTLVYEWDGRPDGFCDCGQMGEILAGSFNGREPMRVWMEDRIVYPDDVPVLEALMNGAEKQLPYYERTLRLLNRKGKYIWYKVAFTTLLDEQKQIKRVIGTLNDVDDAVRSRRALQYQAEFDILTGIRNAQGFYSKAHSLMRRNPETRYAILRMDINRFKLINDIYGMEEGDKLLQFVAESIDGLISKKGVCGRLNSDIFGICVPYEEESQLTALISELIALLSGYGLGCAVSASFGICAVDDWTVPVSILCDWANLALKTVKGNLMHPWAFYDDKLRARQLYERSVEAQMENALEQGQFTVYLQPKHDLRDGRIIGAEALVRWQHPKQGLLSPASFVPLFERNGFIVRLDESIWEMACRILRSWIDRDFDPVPISVNISRIHIYNPGFEEKILRLSRKYKLSPELLELELTESTFVQNPEELYKIMNGLQKKGFSFSMDDFGSGYSSLNMLKNAPVNTIKLDREFLNETSVTRKGQTVIQHTISMARQLDLQVIAEGVETRKQAEFLIKSGCLAAQGFYFSKPMPVQEFEALAFKCEQRRIGEALVYE